MAGVAQWIECQPVNQRVTGWIPSQGTCLDCGPGPLLEVCKGQLSNVSLAHVRLPLFLPSSPLSKNK